MESNSEQSQGRSQSSNTSISNYPSRRFSPRISTLQGTITLMLLILMIHCHGAASKRNEGIMTFEMASPWNKTFYKIERGCQDFHAVNESSKFYYWPEDDPYFDHCCSRNVTEDGVSSPGQQRMADDYTYGINGPELRYSVYYDLGMIDQCLPFWKCDYLYDKLYEHVMYHIPCERTDLQGLYSRRFWSGTVLKYGLLQSATLFIVSLEVAVISVVALYCVWRRGVVSRRIIRKASKAAFKAMYWAVLLVWIHLTLLAIIGNGLIEATGRQNVYVTRSKSFYNYAWLYVVLTVLVWYSSFLQQLCYCITVIEDCVLSQQGQISDSRPYGLKELETEIGLNADWKWQPIAAQIGILFVLWGFLTYIDDNNNAMAGAVFGMVVQAAGPWSGLYASKLILHALSFLGRKVLMKLKTRKELKSGQSTGTSSRMVTGWREQGAHSGRQREQTGHNSKDEGPAMPLSRDSELENGELGK